LLGFISQDVEFARALHFSLKVLPIMSFQINGSNAKRLAASNEVVMCVNCTYRRS
jgi:hypothetical protein